VLAAASAELVGSLDGDDTLARVARAALPVFADMCSVFVAAVHGHATQVAVRHIDGVKEKLLAAYVSANAEAATPFGHAAVLGSGAAELVVEVTDERLLALSRSDEHLAVLRAAGLQSLITVPLTAGEKVFGAIGFGIVQSGRRYDERDLTLAKELGKRAGAVLENARLFREAQRANLAKDEFMAILGHELRNALAPIMTGLQLLKLQDSSRGLGRVEAMERQAKHLVRLVDDLLDISRITSGKVSLEKARSEISAVVSAAVEMARPAIARAGHDLSVTVPTSGLVVDVDGVRISQVLANLLTNAAKFTPPGGQISISARRRDEAVEVRVDDNGIGIAPEQLPSLFEPFVQARQTLLRTHDGLGLGLAIVKSLVGLHDGSVSAYSAGIGKGSSFVVRLPLLQAVKEGFGTQSANPSV
jgi:signal transduction histidine kinase